MTGSGLLPGGPDNFFRRQPVRAVVHSGSRIGWARADPDQNFVMTRTPVAAEPPTVDQPATDQPATDHVNEIVLVGELASPAESRTLPSGDEVVSFRLTVRCPATPLRRGTRAEPEPSRSHSDSLDCVARRPALRARLLRGNVGDVVRVEGALRHRYWRGPSGINSRYEVEVEQVTTVLRRRLPATAPAGAR